MAIYSRFTHKKWWFSIVTLVYPQGSIHIGYIAVGAAQKHISTFGFGKHVSHAQVTFGLVDPNRWTLGKMIPRMHGILSQDSRLGSGTLQPENTEHVANGQNLQLLNCWPKSDLFEHRLMHEPIFCHIGDFRKYVIGLLSTFLLVQPRSMPISRIRLAFEFSFFHSSTRTAVLL